MIPSAADYVSTQSRPRRRKLIAFIASEDARWIIKIVFNAPSGLARS